MKASCTTGQVSARGKPCPTRRIEVSDGRDCPHRHLDDLRNRPVHPQGTSQVELARSSATKPLSELSSRSAMRRLDAWASAPRRLHHVMRVAASARALRLRTGGGGWILGHRIDGPQAELARVPFADTSDSRAARLGQRRVRLLLADILPTSYEVGVTSAADRRVTWSPSLGGPDRPRCRHHGAAADAAESSPSTPRTRRAREAGLLGADAALDPGDHVLSAMNELTDGLGADVAIEAARVPEMFEIRAELTRPGGRCECRRARARRDAPSRATGIRVTSQSRQGSWTPRHRS